MDSYIRRQGKKDEDEDQDGYCIWNIHFWILTFRTFIAKIVAFLTKTGKHKSQLWHCDQINIM